MPIVKNFGEAGISGLCPADIDDRGVLRIGRTLNEAALNELLASEHPFTKIVLWGVQLPPELFPRFKELVTENVNNITFVNLMGNSLTFEQEWELYSILKDGGKEGVKFCSNSKPYEPIDPSAISKVMNGFTGGCDVKGISRNGTTL